MDELNSRFVHSNGRMGHGGREEFASGFGASTDFVLLIEKVLWHEGDKFDSDEFVEADEEERGLEQEERWGKTRRGRGHASFEPGQLAVENGE